jgi:hypothetical protein
MKPFKRSLTRTKRSISRSLMRKLLTKRLKFLILSLKRGNLRKWCLRSINKIRGSRKSLLKWHRKAECYRRSYKVHMLLAIKKSKYLL